jgi:DNA-binding winged helix-turn-helix (wHTH) protein
MKPVGQSDVFQFEGFRLDRRSRVLFRRDEAGEFVPMAVGSRTLEVLDVLLGRSGNLISRDEFMAAIWPATAVEDTNLNMQIAALRRILDEGRTEHSRIQTIPGHGYRFALPVTRVAADALARQPSNVAPLPDKPSLAVMPFQNLSGDPAQEYFADGVVEEIISAEHVLVAVGCSRRRGQPTAATAGGHARRGFCPCRRLGSGLSGALDGRRGGDRLKVPRSRERLN